jgi:hypothetical protein
MQWLNPGALLLALLLAKRHDRFNGGAIRRGDDSLGQLVFLA